MTTIYQIRDNLIRTIEGKQAYLVEVRKAREESGYSPGDLTEDASLFATQKLLKENIRELSVILKDVAECCTKATEASWVGVDRQGGI
jgi:hypothetical protein